MTALLVTAGAIAEAILVWRFAARIHYRRGHADGVAAASALAYPDSPVGQLPRTGA